MTYARDRVDLYRDHAGKWRWRRWTGSRITADSAQGYKSKWYAKLQAKRHNPKSVVRDASQ